MFNKINHYLSLIENDKISENELELKNYQFIGTSSISNLPDSATYGFKVYNIWNTSHQKSEIIFSDINKLIKHISEFKKKILEFGGQEHYIIIPESDIFFHINPDLTTSLIKFSSKN